MHYFKIVLVCFLFQNFISVTKNNGESVVLTSISFFQTKETATSKLLTYIESEEEKSVDISKLKRINIKELVSRNKGVQRWKVILVEKSNKKYDVELDLVEVSGKNQEGQEQMIPANAINKITL